MKRHELLAHLKANGCELLREGTRHSIWWNPARRLTTSVPRHTEVSNLLARKICRDLGIPTPPTSAGPNTLDPTAGSDSE